MSFLKLWGLGIVNPKRFADELDGTPAPCWGLAAVGVRFVGTSLTTMPLALLLRSRPFQPSVVTFLPIEAYYRYQIFFLPLFGVTAWLLMSGVAHLAMRLGRHTSDFDRVLNIVGLGMLIPMPIAWLWDWAMLGFGLFQMATMSISHSAFQLWEVALEALCFRRSFHLRIVPSILLAVAVNVIFILLAAALVR